jgi:PIN domain nuclease of toxin-antitoxin system
MKAANGKLKAPPDLTESARGHGFSCLSVEPDHAWAVRHLPLSDHKDPFDRQLVAQALVEGLPVISRDHRLDRYGIERVW